MTKLPEPYYDRDGITLYVGDNREVLPELDVTVSAVVTDPPYGLSFMGKDWDHSVPGEAFWRIIRDVMAPGAHLLSFGGTRTFHRIAVAIEDAGFEIRDTLMWLYGSGFPKSHDVSKAIDKQAGAEREKVPATGGLHNNRNLNDDGWSKIGSSSPTMDSNHPATPEAERWQGWGTALKPSVEPVIWAQKPYTYAGERDIIVGNLQRLEAQLWSLLPANIAETSFGLSPSEYDAVCVSAQWSADERRNTQDALSDLTDTSRFVSVMTTCLNTVISWSNILGALWSDTSTSTTETQTSPTIDLKTLRCLLSPLTPRIIIQAAMEAHGSTLSALPAARYFLAVEKSMNATRELSALASATDAGHTGHPAETGLTPNHEPIILARKPLAGTVAANVLAHGTGALNIDASRIPTDDNLNGGAYAENPTERDNWVTNTRKGDKNSWRRGGAGDYQQPAGRWPANVILDEDAAAALDAMSGVSKSQRSVRVKPGGVIGNGNTHGRFVASQENVGGFDDAGGASRFFYVAKASRKERNAGLDGMRANTHPTVKPLALMRYLITLVTPPGGIVLDPFAGSGTTLVACAQLGIPAVGIEMSEEYAEIAARRIDHAINERTRPVLQPALEMSAD